MRDGYRSECIACHKAARGIWYEENRERVIAKVVTWQRENRERYNERLRDYKRAHPELDRAGHLSRKFGLTLDAFDELCRLR